MPSQALIMEATSAIVNGSTSFDRSLSLWDLQRAVRSARMRTSDRDDHVASREDQVEGSVIVASMRVERQDAVFHYQVYVATTVGTDANPEITSICKTTCMFFLSHPVGRLRSACCTSVGLVNSSAAAWVP